IHAGSSFFTGWNFFTGGDPTNGNVEYVSKSTATSDKLAYIQSDGTVVLKVDNTSTLAAGANRNSVRISTSATYTTALMIFDIIHMPWGCSVRKVQTYYTLWTVGPNWPNQGEIDIIEGVNNITNNQVTFHTGYPSACNTTNVPSNWVTSPGRGDPLCASNATADAGCGFFTSNDPAQAMYGDPFNAAGGGVFALLLNSAGAKVWQWPRNAVPQDVKAGHAPKPDGWGLPTGMLPSDSSCPTTSLITSQSIVFDTTLCGGWATDAYTGNGCPGACTDMVANPRNYD
ncbi:hypothetical protein DL93DRAFT_2043787, partial [Clavulina sp. PMI_390]